MNRNARALALKTGRRLGDAVCDGNSKAMDAAFIAEGVEAIAWRRGSRAARRALQAMKRKRPRQNFSGIGD